MGENKTEKIGKITLDYSCYPEEDFYCDGTVEDELLEIAKKYSAVEYAELIEEKKSWPILYHLSPLRENIVDFLPITKADRVLEVGSGCGAVTGALARRAGSVTCVDLSKKRSQINAYRHSECENVTIHVGNFKDIEPTLPKEYEYICLIGVFEYGQSYIGGDRPYEEFLEILLRHLAPGGRIVIAIENQYGLKYFAGCKEDHLGTWFSGIEDYAEGGGVRTFSRPGLERIFESCGVRDYQFYYPYPDYKFMTTVYSDCYLPGKGELCNNIRNFDRDRMLLFDEKHAFDGIIKDGLFSVFSNSYMAVLGAPFAVKYARYSNDRAPEYRIRTLISQEPDGSRYVCKYPMTPEAEDHVRGMKTAYESLKERYAGGALRLNACELVEAEGSVYAKFPFEKGRPLSELLDECLDRQDTEGFEKLFDAYVERIGYHEEYPAVNYDPVFSNLLVDGENWTLIDYEWTFGKAVPTKELAFRAIYCYLLEDEKRNRLDLDRILGKLEISEQEAENYRREETDFQRFVTGKRCSMAQLRDLVGGELLTPYKWVHKFQSAENALRVQIYEDTGRGYSEEESRFLRDAYVSEQQVEFETSVSGDVRMLRIDPAMDFCLVKLQELRFNGETVNAEDKKLVTTNGRMVRGTDPEKGRACPDFVFPTADPNINLCVENLSRQAENKLYARFLVVRLPEDMARDLYSGVKRLFL